MDGHLIVFFEYIMILIDATKQIWTVMSFRIKF